MGAPTRYVHIGQPKCASTALQNSFFANHPELFHLGSGHAAQTGQYIARDVARVLEVDFRFRKNFLWQPERARSVFNSYFDQAAGRPDCRAVGISSEFLGFTLGNEIDVTTKAARLFEVFGAGTRIVLVIREQMALLRSLHGEMIKGGYPGNWRQFLEYTFLYQDRNWCFDFCFDRLWHCYAELFGADNLVVLPFEQLAADETGFLGTLCEGLGVSDVGISLQHRNPATDPVALEMRRQLNEKWPHEFGSAFYRPFHSTRMRAYFEDELGVRVPHERAVDDLARGPIGQFALEAQASGPVASLDYSVPKALSERLAAIYRTSNAAMQNLTGIDLDALGYPV